MNGSYNKLVERIIKCYTYLAINATIPWRRMTSESAVVPTKTLQLTGIKSATKLLAAADSLTSLSELIKSSQMEK